MKVKISLCGGIILCALHMFVLTAVSEERNPALDETVTVRLGPLWSSFNTTISVFGQGVNDDDSIEVDDASFAAYGLWRITERFRIEAGYSGIDKETGSDIGLGVSNEFETSVARFTVGYALYRGDASEFGLDLGINYTTIKSTFSFAIPGLGAGENGPDVSEPLPTLGVFFNYAFSQKWYLTSRAGVFAFDIGDIEGTIVDVFGGVEVRPWKHLGVGLAYMYNSADIDIKDNNIDYDVEYDYHGPLLYLVGGF